MERIQPIRLRPIYQQRVWGGNRLQPDAGLPVGEAWVVYEGNQVEGGVWANQTLADVSGELGEDLLGSAAVAQTGDRFPLLIKLLDSREWLSVQVHPNDEQAARLEGPGLLGKTEAWHILEAELGARVVSGLRSEQVIEELDRRAAAGGFEDVLQYVPVEAGDTLFTPAGCVHAIGPGLFIYEVQQASDITYRLYDWNRPQSAGRALHLDKGLQVVEFAGGTHTRRQTSDGAIRATLVECAYFTLEMVYASDRPVRLNTEGRSFHALTVTQGSAEIRAAGASERVATLESVVIPAAAGAYEIHPQEPIRLLLSRVP